MKKKREKRLLKMLSFCQKLFSWSQVFSCKCSMSLIHSFILANVRSLYTKYQNVPEIYMGVEFLIQTLSKQYVELQRAVNL